MRRLLPVLALFLFASASAQDFDPDAYAAFLEAHADLSGADLARIHAAGTFLDASPAVAASALYRDSLDLHYELTEDEEALLDRHGFMVTERLQPLSFANGFLDVYTADLPVFLSTDAVLHALHMSYDSILMQTEVAVLSPLLSRALAALHGEVAALATDYAAEGMRQPVRDLDVYLTVARALLAEGSVAPVFSENAETMQDLLALIDAEQMAMHPLFSEGCRQLDFSQFTVRGHYSQDPNLGRYFQAMMWLGRTEIYLSKPQTAQCAPTDADVQRQTILAHLLAEAAERSGARHELDQIDALLARFVGEPDNVTLDGLATLASSAGVTRASDLLDADRQAAYADALANAPWAAQRIRSQILISGDPTQPNGIQPAAAFLLMGQRFVIDSYVTASVVFDAIEYQGQAVRRMMPSTLDVLFALGNDAAGQLLAPELETFPYASNLVALRHLIDGYPDDFWDGSLYNGWLGSIRTLNPPSEADRARLPDFMQTAAWWQQKASTQLAAWAQLRHDNLLYAKQSYTGGILCEYPYSYVEPIPAFYESIARFARTASAGFEPFADIAEMNVEPIQRYFGRMATINDTLATISEKELAGIPVDEDERVFLRKMLYEQQVGCAVSIDGWYKDLYFGGGDQAQLPDMVVADVHTTPTDASGAMVGWVLHAGTGPLNLAVVTAEVPGVGPVTFTGPVMSYYEHVSTNFQRLTDEAWQTAYAAEPSFRPDFVNLYLADANGNAYPAGASLERVVDTEEPPDADAPHLRLTPNVPNPFSEQTVIGLTVARGLAAGPVDVSVYDVRGRLVRQLLDQSLPAGHYTIAWDGTDASGRPVASGTYLVRAITRSEEATRSLTLVR